MAGPQFSVDDLRTPERLELVLRQFQSAMRQGSAGMAAHPPNLADLALKLAPMIRDQLQSPGVAPLNLQSLIPNQGQAVILEDTHANRLSLYPASNYQAGAVFYETDRTVTYVVVSVSGALVWQYVTGVYYTTFANRPTDLSTYDSGFLYVPTEHLHWCRWSGTAWQIVDDDGGTFVSAARFLDVGFQLCDGTATSYLSCPAGVLTQVAFTTPDLATAPAGVYLKSLDVAYTGTINAATAPGVTGSTANTTATNQNTTATNNGATTGITVDAHGTTQITDVVGANNFAFTAGADAGHTVNDPSHNHTQNAHTHTQNAHNHAAGTIAVDSTGEPRNLGAVVYLRR